MTFSITINVTNQYPDPNNNYRDIIEGSWTSPDAGFSNDPISGTITSGHVTGSYLKFYLEKPTGNVCYYRIHIADYILTDQATGAAVSMHDPGAYMDRNCTRSTGSIELYRS